MSAAIDYAQWHEDVIEPVQIEVERAVRMLRDGGIYERFTHEDVVIEMADSAEYTEVLYRCATTNPASPEGKRAMDAMSDLFDQAARKLVEAELQK